MIRVLVCDFERGLLRRLRDAVEHVSDELGYENVDITLVPSFDLLRQRVSTSRADLYDLAICRIPADDGVNPDDGPVGARQALDTLDALREMEYSGSIIPISSAPKHVAAAMDAGIDGVVPAEGGYLAFKDAVEGPLRTIAEGKEERVCVKSHDGLSNIALDAILFAESTKRGPLIHLPDEERVLTTGTLQALFERLGGDNRFVKAGSSFIVNLDNIRTMGERSVIFADGEAIIVPIRVDKPLRESYEAYCAR